MIFLNVEHIVRLQKKIINATGGLHGILDEGVLKSSVNNAFSTFDGQDLYPTFTDKVANICYCLIANHPFNDGNKRIGIYIMLITLEINKFHLEYTQDELVTLGLDVADGKISAQQIKQWIDDHMIP